MTSTLFSSMAYLQFPWVSLTLMRVSATAPPLTIFLSFHFALTSCGRNARKYDRNHSECPPHITVSYEDNVKTQSLKASIRFIPLVSMVLFPVCEE